MGRVLGHLWEALRLVGLFVSPFLPSTADRIWRQLGIAMPVSEARLAAQGRWGIVPGPHTVAKGDPLQTARLAGIMAAKQTSALIPLCHPLMLTHVSVELEPTRRGYRIESRARTSGQTGVEMEALTAAGVHVAESPADIGKTMKAALK